MSPQWRPALTKWLWKLVIFWRGHLFVFRGRKANLIKIVFWDGTGLCLFTKRLEQGVFLWPPDVDPGETLALSSEQLSMLIDGVDWRAPERRWRPAVAG